MASDEALRQAYEQIDMLKHELQALRGQHQEEVQALRENEMIYYTLAENAPAFIGIAQDARFRYVNPAFLRVSGYTLEEIQGKTITDIVVPEERDLLLRRLELMQRGEAMPEHHEYHFCVKTGETVVVDLIAAPIRYHGRPAVMGIAFDITQRRNYEEALRDSEERYRAFSEASTEGIVMHEQGKILEFNQAIVDHLGYSPEELRQKSVLELTAPESREEMVRHIMAGDPGPYIATSLHKDGSRTIGEIVARNFIYRGRPVRLVAMRDITAYKQAEAALRASEQRLTLLIDTAVVGLVIHDANGVVIRSNPTAQRLLGMSDDEMRGHTLFDPPGRFLREDGSVLPAMEYPVLLVLALGEPVRDRIVGVQQPGRRDICWILTNAVPVRNAEGQISEVIITFMDITARKQVEEALREQRQFLRTIIDTVPNFIGVKDWESRFVLANRALAEVYGTTPEELIGKSDADFNTNPAEVAWFKRDDQEVIRTRQVKIIPEERVTDSTGRVRWLSTIKVPLIEKDGSASRLLLATHDITDRKRAEEEHEAFIHTISHDLRAPLTIIKGHAELVRDSLERAGVNGTLQESISAISRSVQRMSSMIRDLVESARLEAGKPRMELHPVSLPDYVANLLERARMLLAVDRITVDIPPDLPAVSADYDRLERILVNLLSNALKYSPEDAPVLMTAKPRKEMVVVSITDQGEGISPEDVPRLFDRFFRTKTALSTEGIGLGLYITKMLVEAHGGSIWLESTPGKGSTFFFTLPIAAAGDAQA